MKALRSFLRLLHAQLHRTKGGWHKLLWRYGAFVAGGRVVAGARCTFHVPVRSDGQGSVALEDDVILGFPLASRVGRGEILLQARGGDATIRVGRSTCFSNNVSLVAEREIALGAGCLIGDSVMIADSDFHELNPATRTRSSGLSRPVIIGNNVWLGSRVMILKGVTIGDNSVVGAMSVVTRSIPPDCIAAGAPAKVLRRLEAPPPLQSPDGRAP